MVTSIGSKLVTGTLSGFSVTPLVSPYGSDVRPLALGGYKLLKSFSVT